MSEHSHAFVRDDGETEIEVYYEVESYGSPASWWDPGDSAELYIVRAELIIPQPADPDLLHAWSNSLPPYDDASWAVELTDTERDRIETEIHENPEWWEPYDDFDDFRDQRIDDRLTGGGQ